jgi:hypothetical protein
MRQWSFSQLAVNFTRELHAFEGAKTDHSSDRAATVIGTNVYHANNILWRAQIMKHLVTLF